jgi:IS30 family transposase
MGCVELAMWEREEISRGVAAGRSGRSIALGLGRHNSVVNREIARHGGRFGYRASLADAEAVASRRRPKLRKVEADGELLAAVNAGLGKQWSPQQIAKRIELDHAEESGMRISHETVYQALYCQARGALRVELAGELRRGGARRVSREQRRELVESKSQVIPNMVLISERPPEVEERAVPGHWEGDLVMGERNRSAVVTLVERYTRFLILLKLNYDHRAERVALVLASGMVTVQVPPGSQRLPSNMRCSPSRMSSSCLRMVEM